MTDDWRADVAEAIADGADIDWSAVRLSPAASIDPALLEELRVLEQVVRVHTHPLSPRSLDHLPAGWGPLTVIEYIGSGTFGDVYRAHDPRLDRAVALKLLRRQDPAEASGVVGEARLLARVSHPNVVAVYGAERIEGRVGVWMRFIEGPTLEEELRRKGSFDPPTVARIGLDLCDALVAVHNAGVVHQDVKAQNVMRTPDGRVVLMDFGAGREASEVTANPGVQFAGTPLYLAPEAVDGAAPSRQSDIYSLGVLLFHLLTGSFPVAGRTIADLRREHARARPTPLRAVRADVPARLAHIVDRCLAPKPADRFEDAGAVGRAQKRAAVPTLSAPRAITAAAIAFTIVAASFACWQNTVTRPPPVGGPASRLLTKLPVTSAALGRISHDGRLVSYVDYSTGNLLVRDLTTGQDRRITDKGSWAQSKQYAEQSAISRDGRSIAYTWFEPSRQRFVLRVASLDGTGVPPSRVLLDREDLSWMAPFDWSPDNNQVVVHRDLRDSGGDLALVSVRDGSTKVLKRLDRSGPSRVFFSPDGRYVAFDQVTGQDQRIVSVASSDGSRETPVLAAATRNTVVGWSPDGRTLLVASDRGEALGLWAVAMAEGAPHGPPILLRPSTDPESIGLSASGALYSVTMGNRTNVEVNGIDLESGTLIDEPRRRIERFVGFNTDPAWSADGQYLAFISNRNEAGMSRVLAIQSDATGELRELHPKLDLFLNPSWAPNGQSIVVAGTDTVGRPGVFEIDLRSGSVSVLVRKTKDLSYVFHPQWSPDGRRLYYRLTDQDPRGNALAEWDRATGTERVLFRQDAYIDALELSPDGQLIAMSLEDGAVMVVAVADGDARHVFRSPRSAADREDSLTWTRDGRALLFSVAKSEGRSQRQLWFVPIDGGQPRAISGTTGYDITLRPDGRKIAFTTRSEQRPEVWVLEHFLPDAARAR
jgi:Tol biopolymer transport system component